MHPAYCETLVSALEKRFSLYDLAESRRDELVSYFINIELPSLPQQFSEELPRREFAFRRSGEDYSMLSPRRLINPSAPGKNQSPIFLGRLVELLGGHSSDLFVSEIRKDPGLVGVLSESSMPSLLCRVETYASKGDRENGCLSVQTQPLLVIPGCTHPEAVELWEQRHTIIEEERRFCMFPYRRLVRSPVYKE